MFESLIELVLELFEEAILEIFSHLFSAVLLKGFDLIKDLGAIWR
jgi:hypothetical protein